MHNVFVLDSAEAPYGSEIGIEREVLSGCAHVELLHLRRESDFDAAASEADALIVWRFRSVGEHMLNRIPRVRAIVRNGIGFDNVDIDVAARLGIPVSNVPDYATEEVADHAIALTLALIRQIRPLSRHVATGGWDWSAGEGARRIRELTFGVVGCGRIGTAAALRARALGFRVVIFDPHLPPGFERGLGVIRAVSVEELVSSSDVVSLHVPLTTATRGMFDSPLFGAFRRGAYLINTARGPVVRTEALVEALSSGTLAGAGLDVLDGEPAGATDLLAFPNVLVTPHAAFYSAESLDEVRRTSSGMIREVLEGASPRNVVNGVAARRK
jgi:phosphoglycerate dehydrogenase-like enzyme